jgi:release factor glutamine methyltransferase
MLLKEVIQKTAAFFKEKGLQSPRLDTEILLAKALGWERIKLYLNYDYPLNEAELNQSRELVKRRLSGEPVAYILGQKDFYKSTFKITPAVLIPRPETEELVEKALNHFKIKNLSEPFWIIDFGTGSGCIGLSLLSELPLAKLIAVDISAQALEVAAQNAAALGLSERVVFLQKDVSEITPQEVLALTKGQLAQAVLANPPYIATDDPNVESAVRKFEPAQALFSNEKGLAHIRAWSAVASAVAADEALVLFEIGSTQGLAVKELFAQIPAFEKIEILKDLSAHDRLIRAFQQRG